MRSGAEDQAGQSIQRLVSWLSDSGGLGVHGGSEGVGGIYGVVLRILLGFFLRSLYGFGVFLRGLLGVMFHFFRPLKQILVEQTVFSPYSVFFTLLCTLHPHLPKGPHQTEWSLGGRS